jgi:membrane protein
MIRPKHLLQLALKAAKAWSADYAPSMGAAISYYTVFSLAPLLMIVIAIAGAVFGRDAVTGAIVQQLGGLIGEQGATLIQTIVASASLSGHGLIAGGISAVVLIMGATSVFTELQSALDRIWHVPPSEKPQGIWATVKSRILSFGLILGLGFLLIVSLAVSAAIAAFAKFTSGILPGYEVLLHAINTVVSLGIFTVLFAMIFKLMPSAPIAWRDVWIGAVTTAVLFEVGKVLIGLYLGKSSMAHAFAAAGSVVVLLAWVYYAAQIFLLGAEFTKVFADDHGSRKAGAAMMRTAATAAAGVPTEGPAGTIPMPHHVVAKLAETDRSALRNRPQHDPALDSPAFKATDAGLKAALAGLYTEVAALVVVTIAGSILHKKRQAAERKLTSAYRAS